MSCNVTGDIWNSKYKPKQLAMITIIVLFMNAHSRNQTSVPPGMLKHTIQARNCSEQVTKQYKVLSPNARKLKPC